MSDLPLLKYVTFYIDNYVSSFRLVLVKSRSYGKRSLQRINLKSQRRVSSNCMLNLRNNVAPYRLIALTMH